ncbi:MAG: glycosyltransferase family 1 protein [Pseudomonadota bacterium]
MTATVLIDVERLRSPANGLGQVARHLGSALLDCHSELWRPVFLMPPGGEHRLGESVDHISADWRRRHFPSLGRRFDLWHVTHQDAAFLPPRDTPCLLTIHDLNFLTEKTLTKARRRLARVQRLVDRAARITTISAFTREVVLEHLRIGARPVDVVPNAPCLATGLTPERPNGAPEGPYVLALGVVRPKKNLHVLPAFLSEVPGTGLCVAGNTDSTYVDRVRSEAQKYGVSDRVHVLGEVSESEKQWLLQQCEALVFPSRLEGFGLPVIEAMSHGKPVFCSRCASLPEIGGDAAFYWETFDPASMARVFNEAMARFATDDALAERCRSRAAEFSWPAAARAYGAIYTSMLSEVAAT